jgi:hypothetical protein
VASDEGTRPPSTGSVSCRYTPLMEEDRVVANACLTTVAFPETVAEVLDLAGGHQENGGNGFTDMELLLAGIPCFSSSP